MEFADLRKKASDLRKQGAWEEALACYEELTFRFADDCTEWEYWGRHTACLSWGNTVKRKPFAVVTSKKRKCFSRWAMCWHGRCIVNTCETSRKKKP